ncbi:tRNA (adenosine(37)-N6)-threonylcarbamoyltransferase complex dimerization subunit type 1 TsaB [Flavobacteriaceae bacterium Ap0902]|nr:tRNA (adenosine(37)-N6)-threonylcarbamoyltransferase complex dimerization subunit type 1 TsaB [Flavobacteriaceae bacterium Ap0902]
MALILNLETSTKNCSVSISKDGELFVLYEETTDGYQHAEKLHTFMNWALETENLSFEDLDAVCVGKGPGSYTGLRIGVSAAKGLCFALDIPLLAINSLEIMSEAIPSGYDLIIPMTDARRKEVYTAVYDEHKNLLEKTHAKILDDQSFLPYADKSIVFVGDGAEKAEEILNLPHATYKKEILPSAKNMCKTAENLFIHQQFEDLAYFEPFYLKDFVAGK